MLVKACNAPAASGLKPATLAAIVRIEQPIRLPHAPGRAFMTQTNNRFLDELAKLMTDAAGGAQGVRRDFETMVKSQGERMLREMDVVQREEFEAVKEMAVKAREQNEQLAARVAALESELAALKRQP
jgi:BMFP domain-containing protein YqiC